jgi:transposase
LGQLRHFAQHSTQCHSFRTVPSAAAISGPKSTTSEDSHDQQMSSASASKILQFGWGVQIPNTASLLVLDAIFYLVRGGIAWRALPADFPPHQTVYALFRRWTRARAWCRIYAALGERARLADGRGPVPTAAVIDSQTVRARRHRPDRRQRVRRREEDQGPQAARRGRHRRAAAGRRGHDRLLARAATVGSASPPRCARRSPRSPGVGRRRVRRPVRP